jgi:hypothetical protein
MAHGAALVEKRRFVWSAISVSRSTSMISGGASNAASWSPVTHTGAPSDFVSQSFWVFTCWKSPVTTVMWAETKLLA